MVVYRILTADMLRIAYCKDKEIAAAVKHPLTAGFENVSTAMYSVALYCYACASQNPLHPAAGCRHLTRRGGLAELQQCHSPSVKCKKVSVLATASGKCLNLQAKREAEGKQWRSQV